MSLFHPVNGRACTNFLGGVAEGSALQRFVEAQALTYSGALAKIRRGAKHTHWMWFIFPQLAGLGRSLTARFYGIASADEARSYIRHPVPGRRYFECVEALQDLTSGNPVSVFGDIDAMKLRSSLTLFESVAPCPLFTAALDRCFRGELDVMTLAILAEEHAGLAASQLERAINQPLQT